VRGGGVLGRKQHGQHAIPHCRLATVTCCAVSPWWAALFIARPVTQTQLGERERELAEARERATYEREAAVAAAGRAQAAIAALQQVRRGVPTLVCWPLCWQEMSVTKGFTHFPAQEQAVLGHARYGEVLCLPSQLSPCAAAYW
jgi:hypothetical protein